jgi:alpha,alpha-trehalose phosphorylase
MMALGNGYIGMRGCPEEGGHNAESSTLINGFYETRPIIYAEEAYGFARTGQTICNVTDSKIIKLFVDDEPFWLPDAHLLRYDRRLNMKSGTLDRDILWETPAGKHVSIKSRRLSAKEPSAHLDSDDPRLAKPFSGRVLHPRTSYSKERRILLCHATERSKLILACASETALETTCPHTYKTVYTDDFGQVAFTIEARSSVPIEPHQIYRLPHLADSFG